MLEALASSLAAPLGPNPIGQVGIVSYQDKLYILGGSLTPSGAPTNDFFSYSIAPG